MDLVEVISPSGFKAYIKPFLSFGEKRQLEKLWASNISVNATTKEENTDLTGSIIYEVQDLTMKFMIKKLVNKEGQSFEGESAFTLIMSEDFPQQDGAFILKKVDELTIEKNLTEESKKKA